MTSKRSQAKLSSILMKFTVAELEQILPQTFFTFKWCNVLETLEEYRLDFSLSNFVKVICSLYKDGKSKEKSLESLIPLLQFRDVFMHMSHDWAGVKLESRGDGGINNMTDDEELRTAIKRGFRSRALSAKVWLLHVDSIKWVMVQELIMKRNTVKNGPPMFFCCSEFLYDVPFIFITPKTKIPQYTLEILSEVLGFLDYRYCDISGRNVRHLFPMVTRKCSMALVPVPDYTPAHPVHKSNMISDYTQNLRRKEYAGSIFQNLIQSNELSVESRVSWRGGLPIEPSEKIYVQFRFSTRGRNSVEDMIRKMIENDVMSIPLPPYIASYATFSKNKLQIRDDTNCKKRRAEDMSH